MLEIYSGLNLNTNFGLITNESINLINFNNNIIKNLLLMSSLLSLLIGSIVGLVQVKIKRLLAYSTISHVGFILLSLAIISEQSIDSFIFYIIQYICTNLNIFLIIISISYIIIKSIDSVKENMNSLIKDISFISELKNLFF